MRDRNGFDSSNTKNCKICGKIFSNPRSDICPECIARDEEDFQKVRLFLKEFPGSKIDVVEKYTDVSKKKILRYLRQERLELSEGANDFLKCSKCGKPITTGVYCSECYVNFSKEINTLFKADTEKNASAKMHITFNKRK
ncbi:MAG: hypothetical protein HFE59_07790 [Clostridiales bacterium]|nr:hypothetical protein [Clostridiales bacterium]